MSWNWGEKKRSKLLRRKPSAHEGGENSKRVIELAKGYMKRGHTRQRAYALARQKLKQEFQNKPMKQLRGGKVSPK